MIIQIISGFLGAGKTTFINKYISESKDRIVIIENEFGEVGLDKKLIEKDIPVKEINSGCICCSLISDFREGLKEIIDNFSPDRIIIEPSGVAQLSDILKVCSFLSREYGVKVEDKIVIVDICSFDECIESFGSFYTDQIENASIIMFSNTEKLDSGEIDKIIKEIKEMNPSCTIFMEDWRKLDSEILESILSESRKNRTLSESGDAFLNKSGHSHEKGILTHNVFKSIALSNVREFSIEDMSILKEKIHEGYFGKIIRTKGIIPVKTEENSDKSLFWHFDSNLSSFNFRKIDSKKLSNFDPVDLENSVILIGSGLENQKIKDYFLK